MRRHQPVGVERDRVDLGSAVYGIGVGDRRHAWRCDRSGRVHRPSGYRAFRLARRDPARRSPPIRAPPDARRVPLPSTATSASTTGTGCASATTPRCIAYLEAENAYADAMLAPTRPRCASRSSRRSRPRPGDRRVGAGPARPVGVHTRTVEGLQYACTAGAPRGADADGGEQIVCSTRTRSPRATSTSRSAGSTVSPDHRVARVLHRRQRRRALHVAVPRPRRPATDLADVVDDVTYGARVGRRRAHVLLRRARRRDAPVRRCGATSSGPPPATTCSCSQEDDERFFVGVDRTRSGRFVADRRPRRRSRPRCGSCRPTTPDRRRRGRRAARARPRVHGRAPLRRPRTATGSSSSRTQR